MTSSILNAFEPGLLFVCFIEGGGGGEEVVLFFKRYILKSLLCSAARCQVYVHLTLMVAGPCEVSSAI